MIADYKKTSRPQWAGAMLLVAVLACMVLTNAYVAKADFIFGTPTNLGSTVNSSYEDIDSSISSDGLSLYFNSYKRPGGYGNWDIYVTTRDTIDDEWGISMNLGSSVNSSSGEGAPRISADGLSLYFVSDRPGGYGGMDIWVSIRATTQDEWSAPANLGPTVNSSASEALGSISSDGLQLYFTDWYGERPGGYGKTDIWVTSRPTTSEPWGSPVNLGQTVNGPSFDAQPNISADGLALFFSSDRSGGFGKWDIWVTTRATTSGAWGPPVNLGPIVNSSSEDEIPSISSNGSTLYFSSNRPGGFGRYDLWQVSILPVVDFNADGIVDSADVCMMVDHWLTDEPLYDIAPLPYGDGIVDVKDLVLLAEHLTMEVEDPNAPNLP